MLNIKLTIYQGLCVNRTIKHSISIATVTFLTTILSKIYKAQDTTIVKNQRSSTYGGRPSIAGVKSSVKEQQSSYQNNGGSMFAQQSSFAQRGSLTTNQGHTVGISDSYLSNRAAPNSNEVTSTSST